MARVVDVGGSGGTSATSIPSVASRSSIESRLLAAELSGSGEPDGHNRDISPATRSRRGRSATDPDTRLEVFENHWDQVRQVMDATRGRAITGDDVEPVVHYVDQMLSLLIEERPPAGSTSDAPSASQQAGQILACAERERVFELLLTWSSRASAECLERLKLEQLKQYELLIGQCRQSVVGRVSILRPLLRLVQSCCSAGSSRAVESSVVLILHQLCVVLNRSPNLLDACLEVGRAEAGSQFLVFSLLVPYVHREASIGQHARDALLLVMALSARNHEVGRFIAFSSDFCPVLATGLSGLYSSLPRRLPVDSDDWCQLTKADWLRIPDLAQFLNSLEFCNVVVELAHPLVRDQLLHFIYSGFLKPVLGAALHQSSMDEVTAATAYLELFIRRVSEPALLRVLVHFVLLDYYDDYNILESLIGRIKFSNSLLGVVTMSLFRTLLSLHIEDVHYQLLYRYLIPCQHLMLSQRRCLRDVEPYARAADKFASLMPSCCVQDIAEEAANSSSASVASRLRAYESAPAEYLRDAAERIVERTVASRRWAFRYDGVDPPIDVFEGGADAGASSALLATVNAAPLTEIQSAFRRMQAPTAAAAGVLPDDAIGYDAAEDDTDELALSARLFDSSISSTGGEGAVIDRRLSSSFSLVNSSFQQQQQQQQRQTKKPAIAAATTRPYKDSSAHVQSMYTLSFLDTIDSGLDSSAGGSGAASASVAAATAASKTADAEDEEYNMEGSGEGASTRAVANNCSNDSAIDLRGLISQSLDQLPDDFSSFLTLLDSLPASAIAVSDSGGNGISSSSSSSGIESSVISLEAALSEAGLLLAASAPEGGPPRPPLRQASNMSAAALSDSGRFDDPHATTSSAATPSASAMSQASILTTGVLLPLPQPPGLEFLQMPPRPHPSARPPANNFYTIGPFLTALLDKVETMPANSLYVNLLLTNLLSDLACYPQPLLKSLLLNAGLVLQPQVKSLYQALNVVKHRVDCFSYTVDNFDALLLDARRFLHWRVTRSNPEEFESQHLSAAAGNNRSDSVIALPGDRRRTATSVTSLSVASTSGSADWPSFQPQPEAAKKKSFFESLFSSSSKSSGAAGKENRKTSTGGSKSTASAAGSRDRLGLDGLKTRNMVYAAVVLEEFTKELSAICREHSVRPL